MALVSGGVKTVVSSWVVFTSFDGVAAFWQENIPIVPEIAAIIRVFTLNLGAFLIKLFMYKILSLLSVLLLYSSQGISQIQPEEGRTLNYRLVGFSINDRRKEAGCTLEIAAGYYNSKDSFKNNIIHSVKSKDSVIIVEVPSFGQQYTWRIVFNQGKNNSKLTKEKLHHFSTGSIPNVDTTKIRLRVTTPAQAYKDAYIFLDGSHVLYDMSGQPVWYLPNILGEVEKEGADVRDLKLTPQGTITFLINDQRIYEINYDGDVLWRGPRNEIRNPEIHYHHELTRLKNGHYMTMATSPVTMRHDLAAATDSGFLIVTDETAPRDSIHTAYDNFPFSSLVEYDENMKTVWTWSVAKYLEHSDIYYRLPPPRHKRYDVHPNAFCFDEKDSVIYLGFRDISRIIKIKYPGGNVLQSYGDTFGPGKKELKHGLFYGQHSIRKADNGDLYIYNNGPNDFTEIARSGRHTSSTIERLREPQTDKDTLAKTWEYECTIEDYENVKHRVFGFTNGGNVMILPDNSVFASMSGEYAKVFITGTDKKVLFSALPEQWSLTRKRWEILPQYRASIIKDRADLERLILNRKKGN
jgi:hypothetical protein